LICHASSSGRNRFGDGSPWNIKGTTLIHNQPFDGRSFDRFSSQAKSPALLPGLSCCEALNGWI
jgi:hypothetical protein